MPENQTIHWTHRLFVEHPELYLPFLESARERATSEVDAIAGIFSELGVPEKGKVLDVACGIGRHSVLLAQRGYQVTGVDLSPLFIYEANKSAQAVGVPMNFVLGDARAVETLVKDCAPFDAVINMFTSNGYYGRNTDLDMFSQLRRLAAPDAVLVVLTVNRDWLVRNFEPEGIDIAGPIRIWQQRRFDLETSSVLNHWEFYEGQGENLKLRLSLDMDHRVYSLHELKALLEEAGWRYLLSFGSERGTEVKLGEPTLDSQNMWVVMQKI
jgi:SAM-dependent methyltransferase